MDPRERAQRMNRDDKGQFATTVFPFGADDMKAAIKASKIAMHGVSQTIKATFSEEDLAQIVLMTVLRNENLMNSSQEERAKAMHQIARRRFADHIREVRGRGGKKLTETYWGECEVDEGNLNMLGVTDHYASDDEVTSGAWRVGSVTDAIEDDDDGFDDPSRVAADQQLDQQLTALFGSKDVGEGKVIPLKPPISVAALKKHLTSWKRLQAAYDLPDVQAVASSDYVLLTQAVKRLSQDEHPTFQKGVQSLLRQWPNVDFRTKQLFSRHFPDKETADRVVNIMRQNPAVASSVVTTFSVVGRWKGLSEPGSLSIDTPSRYINEREEDS